MNRKKQKQQLTESEISTIKFYDEQGRAWLQKRNPDKPSLWIAEVETFNTLLPTGRILEIGVGGGKEAKLLLQKGYDYVGTDMSETFLDVARNNIPTAILMQATVYDLPFAQDYFDGFWTAATLLHIPKDRIDQALQEIKRVVRNNGIGFISLREGAGEGFDDAGTGRWFAVYSPEEFAAILKRNGFEVVAYEEKIQPSCTVAGRGWIIFFVRVVKK